MKIIFNPPPHTPPPEADFWKRNLLFGGGWGCAQLVVHYSFWVQRILQTEFPTFRKSKESGFFN
jgi:hypothetical protein